LGDVTSSFADSLAIAINGNTIRHNNSNFLIFFRFV
jgi:hypothetical protein